MYVDKCGMGELKRRLTMTTLNVATIAGGAFICVPGTYVTVKSIVDAYKSGTVGRASAC